MTVSPGWCIARPRQGTDTQATVVASARIRLPTLSAISLSGARIIDAAIGRVIATMYNTRVAKFFVDEITAFQCS
jgi:hypothetical protein